MVNPAVPEPLAPPAKKRPPERTGAPPGTKRPKFKTEGMAAGEDTVPASLIQSLDREIEVSKLDWDLGMQLGQIRPLTTEIVEARKAAVRLHPPELPVRVTVWPSDVLGVPRRFPLACMPYRVAPWTVPRQPSRWRAASGCARARAGSTRQHMRLCKFPSQKNLLGDVF